MRDNSRGKIVNHLSQIKPKVRNYALQNVAEIDEEEWEGDKKKKSNKMKGAGRGGKAKIDEQQPFPKSGTETS